ncbi:MAG TPA: hypothetical protein VFJ47_06740 [Terriglobales bacterium]|nr:hypothetical protein [Terriglobales bacterium]
MKLAHWYAFFIAVILASTVACGGGFAPANKSSIVGGTTSSGTSSSGTSSSGSTAGSTGTATSFLQSFTAGIAHASGTYGFTNENYLVEGAERIQQLGSRSIFVYLTPGFRGTYPDRGSAAWPGTDPTSVADLVQSAPFAQVLALPFKTIVLTTYTFATHDHVAGFAGSGLEQAEENEFYNLATYLFHHYAGTGKTFVLKNWEGDWIGLGGQGLQFTGNNISDSMINDMRVWLSARQRGVTRARQDAGNPTTVNVFNAVEVNRVMDFAQKGMARVINTVVPAVAPDMVTYSSYDSTLQGTDPPSMKAAMTLALNTIKQLAPDPLGLGDRRILISEFGLYENERPGETKWRIQTLLSTAKAAGLSGAYMWNVFDNECHEANGQAAPVDSVEGNPLRPTDGECRGLWAIRPDGSTSSVVNVLQKYF